MNGEDKPPHQRLTCSKYFDALYFCYSPVHQMQQYYRVGDLDSCIGKWSAFYDCLKLKTKNASEVEEAHGYLIKPGISVSYCIGYVSNVDMEILKSREKKHIWTFRSPEEARSHWQELFGHLDGEE